MTTLTRTSVARFILAAVLTITVGVAQPNSTAAHSSGPSVGTTGSLAAQVAATALPAALDLRDPFDDSFGLAMSGDALFGWSSFPAPSASLGAAAPDMLAWAPVALDEAETSEPAVVSEPEGPPAPSLNYEAVAPAAPAPLIVFPHLNTAVFALRVSHATLDALWAVATPPAPERQPVGLDVLLSGYPMIYQPDPAPLAKPELRYTLIPIDTLPNEPVPPASSGSEAAIGTDAPRLIAMDTFVQSTAWSFLALILLVPALLAFSSHRVCDAGKGPVSPRAGPSESAAGGGTEKERRRPILIVDLTRDPLFSGWLQQPAS